MSTRPLPVTERLIELREVLAGGGMIRAEVVALCELHVGWNGEESLVERDASYIRRRCECINEYTSRVRQDWAVYDRQSETTREFRAGAASVPVDRNRPEIENLLRQQEAGVDRRERWAAAHPAVGEPGGPVSEFEWHALTFPDVRKEFERKLAQIDRTRGAS